MTDPRPPQLPGATPPSKRPRIELRKHLRAYFLAGVLITAPIGLTFYFAWAFVHWVDSRVTPLIPDRYNPETYLPFTVPGLGLLVVIIGLTLVGALTAGMMGQFWVNTSERVLNRMPVIRTVYGAIKQILETVLARRSQAFRSVVMIEYPRRGIWTLGFITGTAGGEIRHVAEGEMLSVFVPTTPNPTSGFLLFLPRDDLVFLDMTVEEGIKMVISGGIVTPPDRRPAAPSAIRPAAVETADAKRPAEPAKVR